MYMLKIFVSLLSGHALYKEKAVFPLLCECKGIHWNWMADIMAVEGGTCI
jgi:hypothetical protein